MTSQYIHDNIHEMKWDDSVLFQHSVVRLYIGISPMVTSMKSTHESVQFKHGVVRLYKRWLGYILYIHV